MTAFRYSRKLGYRCDDETLLVAKLSRDEKRAAGLCINGPLSGNVGKSGVVHGPVVSGGRCQRCLDAKARSA